MHKLPFLYGVVMRGKESYLYLRQKPSSKARQYRYRIHIAQQGEISLDIHSLSYPTITNGLRLYNWTTCLFQTIVQDGQNSVGRDLFESQTVLGTRVICAPHLLVGITLTYYTTADPGYHMKYQAELGDVDFITGDYLAGE
jgi:hypothetical protein